MTEPNAASVALIRSGEVLLIQRAFEPYAGLWTLPGGRREPGETIEATAIREIGEELGIAVAELRPVLAMALGSGFILKVFAATAFEGAITPSAEIAGRVWLRPDGIGHLPTTPGLAKVLARAFTVVGSR